MPYNASPTDPLGFEGRSVFAAGGEGVLLLLPAGIFMIGRDPLVALRTRGPLCSHTLSPVRGGVHAASVSELPNDKASRSGSSMLGGPGSSAIAPSTPAAGSSTIAPSTPAAVRARALACGSAEALALAVALALAASLRLLPRSLVAGFFFGESSCFADAELVLLASGFADAVMSAAGFADAVLPAGLADVALPAHCEDAEDVVLT